MASRTDRQNRDVRLQTKAEDQQLEQAASRTREHRLVMLSAAQRTKAAKATAEAPAPKGKGKNAKATAPAPKPKKASAANGDAKAPRAKKEGLRTSQIRILEALAKAKHPLTRTGINEACAKAGFATAEKHSAWMVSPLGQIEESAREASEAKAGYPSLLTLGYVRARDLDVDGKKERVLEITAAGKKALDAVE